MEDKDTTGRVLPATCGERSPSELNFQLTCEVVTTQIQRSQIGELAKLRQQRPCAAQSGRAIEFQKRHDGLCLAGACGELSRPKEFRKGDTGEKRKERGKMKGVAKRKKGRETGRREGKEEGTEEREQTQQ